MFDVCISSYNSLLNPLQSAFLPIILPKQFIQVTNDLPFAQTNGHFSIILLLVLSAEFWNSCSLLLWNILHLVSRIPLSLGSSLLHWPSLWCPQPLDTWAHCHHHSLPPRPCSFIHTPQMTSARLMTLNVLMLMIPKYLHPRDFPNWFHLTNYRE